VWRPRSNPCAALAGFDEHAKGDTVNRIIYIVGLVVIVIAILSFFGLR
jgi:hypothetical protein